VLVEVKGDQDMEDCHVFAFVVFMDIEMVDLVMKEWRRVWHHQVLTGMMALQVMMQVRHGIHKEEEVVWGTHRLKMTRYL
jgi:hypothetical protein